MYPPAKCHRIPVFKIHQGNAALSRTNKKFLDERRLPGSIVVKRSGKITKDGTDFGQPQMPTSQSLIYTSRCNQLKQMKQTSLRSFSIYVGIV